MRFYIYMHTFMRCVALIVVTALANGLTASATSTVGQTTSGGDASRSVAERPFGTLREQAMMQQEWLRKRLDNFLPALMRKHAIDLWVVPMREYNEDPVFAAVVAAETFAAGRRVRGPPLDEGSRVECGTRPAGRALGRRAMAGTEDGHRRAQSAHNRHRPIDRLRLLRRPLERRTARHERRAGREMDGAVP